MFVIMFCHHRKGRNYYCTNLLMFTMLLNKLHMIALVLTSACAVKVLLSQQYHRQQLQLSVVQVCRCLLLLEFLSKMYGTTIFMVGAQRVTCGA